MAGRFVADLERRFPGGPTIRFTLEQSLEPPGVTVLFGPSGSGKTTALRLLAGLEPADSGSLQVGTQVWEDTAVGYRLSPQDRGIGLVFQDYALFPHLNVAQNLLYGAGALDPDEQRGRLEDYLRRFELLELAGQFPGALSGGQKQRVAVARALLPGPKLLLLDEPLSALDAPTRDVLRQELRRQLKQAGVPAFLVTHDRLEALTLGDTVVVLIRGKVAQVGPVASVFSQPASLEVARAVGVETVAPGKVVGREDGLLTVEVGRVQVTALDPTVQNAVQNEEGAGPAASACEPGAPVFVCIRAEDVTLESAQGRGPSSARNHLRGMVIGRVNEGMLYRVTLDCGFKLQALITRRSWDELGFEPGLTVVAVVKAPALSIIPRPV